MASEVTSDLKFELSDLNYPYIYCFSSLYCHYFKNFPWPNIICRPATSYLVAGKNGGLLQLAAKVEVTLLSAHAKSDLKRMPLKQEMLSLCSLAGFSHEGVSVFCVS